MPAAVVTKTYRQTTHVEDDLALCSEGGSIRSASQTIPLTFSKKNFFANRRHVDS